MLWTVDDERWVLTVPFSVFVAVKNERGGDDGMFSSKNDDLARRVAGGLWRDDVAARVRDG